MKFALILSSLFGYTIASKFFNTSHYQFENEDQCRPLPNVASYVNQEPLWRMNSTKQVDSNWNLLWPAIKIFRNFESFSRIDFNVEVEDSENEYTTSYYYVRNYLEGDKNRTNQMIFYDADQTELQFQQISDFNILVERTFLTDKEKSEQTCQDFMYQEKLYTPLQIFNMIWRPSEPLNFMTYVG